MVSDFLVIARSVCTFFGHNDFTKCLLPTFLLIAGAGESVSLEKTATKRRRDEEDDKTETKRC